MANKESGAQSDWRDALRPWIRRIGGVAMIGLALSVVVLGIDRLRDPRAFPIRTVKIEGEFRHLDRGRVEEAAGPHVRGGFFSVDLHAVEQALMELPWIHGVSLRRHWPGSLIVRVREQEPVAQWGEAALLNPYGELFYPPRAEFPEGLPRIDGPEARERELLAELARLRITLREHGLDVRVLSEDARRARELELANGIVVALGRADHAGRIRRLIEAYPRALAPRAENIRRIDLRYTNGLAVEWIAADAPAAAETR
jgi:cell division protein FtsQ